MSENDELPEGWKVKKLEEIADVKTGPFGSALHANDYVKSGTPIIAVEHLGEYSITRQNLPLVSNEDKQRLSAYVLQEGDIIFSRVGSVDRNAYVSKYEDGWLFSGRLLRIRSISEDFDTKYLGYYFKSESVKSEIRNIAVGQTMASLNTKLLNAFEIILPPLPEQHAIAEVLSDMDGYITSLEKLIAKKKAVKQGVMQELLTGKRRLPGFMGEWENIELGELLEYEQPTDYIVRSTEYISSGIPVLTAGKSFILGYTVEQEGIYSKYPVILFDDFLTISRYIDFPFKVKSSAVKLLKNKREYDCLKLIFELMQMIEFTVVDHQRHWISQYSKIQLRLPLPEEQSAIAAVLSDMDAETEVLTAKLNKAKFIKQGMMQELLTGRIRLVKPETTAIPVTKVVEKNRHGYSEGYKDAVILVALVNSFGTEQHPFTAFDCQKFPYLFHRYIEGVTKGYKKFAAGPYNPSLKYRTARPIALGKKYIREHTSLYKGFVTDENAEEALGYFEKWYSEEPIKWLEQFRYIKNRKNELELLTTVDMAVVELRAGKKPVIMSAVKEIIKNSAEWKAKLKREIFSDENITRAIAWSIELFGDEE